MATKPSRHTDREPAPMMPVVVGIGVWGIQYSKVMGRRVLRSCYYLIRPDETPLFPGQTIIPMYRFQAWVEPNALAASPIYEDARREAADDMLAAGMRKKYGEGR